jgi:hypothetical protein
MPWSSRLSLFSVVSACAHLSACSSERGFLVCEKAAFIVPYAVPYVVPMRALLLWKIQRFIEFFGISIYFCFSLTFLAFQSIFAFH